MAMSIAFGMRSSLPLPGWLLIVMPPHEAMMRISTRLPSRLRQLKSNCRSSAISRPDAPPSSPPGPLLASTAPAACCRSCWCAASGRGPQSAEWTRISSLASTVSSVTVTRPPKMPLGPRKDIPRASSCDTPVMATAAAFQSVTSPSMSTPKMGLALSDMTRWYPASMSMHFASVSLTSVTFCPTNMTSLALPDESRDTVGPT
mmetsp:Transcript_8526/g.22143  ORF Transcript_8526/g.22143 Transcript_8526/m.22143 type:complete len:203 (-) Transcript_8526:2262-2870(-)